MSEQLIINIILSISFTVALGTFIALFFISAPYGRHIRRGWGPKIPNWLGWLLMEAPSPILMTVFFFIGGAPKTVAMTIFLMMWLAHYVHRAFIYPFQIRDGRKKLPLTVMLMAVIFNTGNGYVNGRYLFHFAAGAYPITWLTDWRFILGVALFAVGFVINRWADLVLRDLRQPGETVYKIPYGGLYRYISCPNYFGEIIEWAGWALATYSLPGLAFAVWTFANLAPRAQTHHKWYRDEFVEYPLERKALIPGIW
jgi:hypothetical protein